MSGWLPELSAAGAADSADLIGDGRRLLSSLPRSAPRCCSLGGSWTAPLDTLQDMVREKLATAIAEDHLLAEFEGSPVRGPGIGQPARALR